MMTMMRMPHAIMRRVRGQCRVWRGIVFRAAVLSPTPPKTVGYAFSELRRVDAVGDATIIARGRAERFGERYADDHRAFGFRTANGALAAYFWCTVAMGRSATTSWSLRSSLTIPSGVAYIWDCFTIPEHRRRGLYTSGLRTLRALAGDMGCTHVIISSATSNAPSIAGIAAAGFHSLGTFTMLRIGFTTVLRTTTHGPSFRRDGDPHAFPFPLDVL